MAKKRRIKYYVPGKWGIMLVHIYVRWEEDGQTHTAYLDLEQWLKLLIREDEGKAKVLFPIYED